MYIKVKNVKYKVSDLTIKQFKELLGSIKEDEIIFKRIGA